MDLTKLLMENLGNGGLETLSSHVGMSKEKTSQAVTAAVPMLLGAMAKNTQGNPKGANGLLGALDRDHEMGASWTISVNSSTAPMMLEALASSSMY